MQTKEAFSPSLKWLVKLLHTDVISFRQKTTERPVFLAERVFPALYFALHDSLRDTGQIILVNEEVQVGKDPDQSNQKAPVSRWCETHHDEEPSAR
jgi:hypothetical protein